MKQLKACTGWAELLAISHSEEEPSSSAYEALEKHVWERSAARNVYLRIL